MSSLPGFQLDSMVGSADGARQVKFPTGRRALICFVKEDCPTCNEIAPVLQQLYTSVGDSMDILVVGQTRAGNTRLIEQHGLTVPLLDDSELGVSFEYDIETVPTLFAADATGQAEATLVGFVKEEWQQLVGSLSDTADVDWAALPDWRPGCGALNVDPAIAERLQARASGSPIRARRIEIAEQDDEFEFMFDQGFSDGLPLVPPTPERVLRMLRGTRRDAQEVIAVMPPNMADVTIEKIAINSVMAGCKPEYLPVVITVIEAICTNEFNIHGVMATTMGASPVVVVNGPIRERIGMNMKLGALGQGNRANTTIGRAVRLTVRNVGGARPGGTERSTLGNPMKLSMCFPEWEERHPWDPLHVERGFDINDSVVSVFAMTSGPTLIVDQDSRTAPQLAGTMGLSLESAFNVKAHMGTDTLLVVCPEHVDTLVRDGYSKADLRARIQEVTARPVAELLRDDISGTGIPQKMYDAMPPDKRERCLPKFRSAEDIHIVVAGSDAGKFSGAFHGWATGEIGSMTVSRKIQED